MESTIPSLLSSNLLSLCEEPEGQEVEETKQISHDSLTLYQEFRDSLVEKEVDLSDLSEELKSTKSQISKLRKKLKGSKKKEGIGFGDFLEAKEVTLNCSIFDIPTQFFSEVSRF